jgi:hypothetical protein
MDLICVHSMARVGHGGDVTKHFVTTVCVLLKVNKLFKIPSQYMPRSLPSALKQ